MGNIAVMNRPNDTRGSKTEHRTGDCQNKTGNTKTQTNPLGLDRLRGQREETQGGETRNTRKL